MYASNTFQVEDDGAGRPSKRSFQEISLQRPATGEEGAYVLSLFEFDGELPLAEGNGSTVLEAANELLLTVQRTTTLLTAAAKQVADLVPGTVDPSSSKRHAPCVLSP